MARRFGYREIEALAEGLLSSTNRREQAGRLIIALDNVLTTFDRVAQP
jgi:hypothetical protein